MNLIDRIIIFIGKQKLNSFRFQHTVANDIDLLKYNDYLPIIKNCYKAAGYWHGTGRYQYKRESNSRYGTINHNESFDILDSIVKVGGIAPHYDPHIEVQGKFIETISVTPFRMYARIYSDMHLYEHNSLLYEYGSSNFWFNIFFISQVVYIKYIPYFFTVSLRKLMSRSLYKQANQWMSVLRKDIEQKPVPIMKSMSIRSDISANYPILIGIKKNALQPISIPQRYTRLETRVDKLISFDDMTHIEVPLEKVHETQEFFKSKSLALPVIPLEFGEIYCNNYSCGYLIYK